MTIPGQEPLWYGLFWHIPPTCRRCGRCDGSAHDRDGKRVLVCAWGVGERVTVPRSWTDRGEPPLVHRLSIESLAELAVVTRAIEGWFVDCHYIPRHILV